MASAVNVTAVDRLAVLIEPLWGQYAFFHSLIESRLHCFFDLVPHPVRVRVELGLQASFFSYAVTMRMRVGDLYRSRFDHEIGFSDPQRAL